MTKKISDATDISLGGGLELALAVAQEAQRSFTTRSGWVRSVVLAELRRLGHDLTPLSQASAPKAEDRA